MVRYVGKLVIALLISACIVAPIASADTKPKNRGLLVTPVREYITVDAGKTKGESLTIANITDVPATVTLSVEQFSVTDFTYDYMFTPTKKDWIKLRTSQVQLRPNKSQEVPYVIDVPKGVAPGGYYFTIFATETLGNDATRKVRVGEALYVTVNGESKLTSHIQKETVPGISLGGDMPFELDVKSTGNTHFLIYVSGRLNGLVARTNGEENAHILLPGTVRTVKGTIPMPFFPGIYNITYGYRVDDGQHITSSKYIVYLPPWLTALLIGIAWIGVTVWRRQRRLSRKKRSTGS